MTTRTNTLDNNYIYIAPIIKIGAAAVVTVHGPYDNEVLKLILTTYEFVEHSYNTHSIMGHKDQVF